MFISREEMSRRSVLRRAGLLGAGLASGSVMAVTSGAAPAAATHDLGGLRWLAGDHHIHTQYSDDGNYRVIDQVQQGRSYGLDWMVITDHGSVEHAKIGVDKVNPDIKAARAKYDGTLVFQGLEWNIPGAEHGTVFVHPGRDEVSLLKEFETAYDGRLHENVTGPGQEGLAIAGIGFLAEAVRKRRVDDALMLANHPARRGVDSPHEIRGWRDAAPSIALGMEGAPGHQAAGIPNGSGRARGYYESNPGPDSFPGYPPESYRTYGGFDWMTATVGGLWDSLLAEGKPWWITANSDSHSVYADTSVRGPNSDFKANGKHADPVHSGKLALDAGDFWPGCYSRTHVGAANFSYAAVMEGIRAGRVWVDHGGLISGIDVRLRGARNSVTLGGVLHVRRGSPVDLTITIDLANGPNWAQFVPMPARVDVIQGDVTGEVSGRDTMTAPRTKVVKSFEVNKSAGTVRLTYALGRLDRPVYVRLRGTDGKRAAPGFHGAAVDPAGPAIDVLGDADPWRDLWFYTNPIWALPS
jgi:hypothetical protein